MPLTNFPSGVSSFGLPVVGSGPVMTTGSVFFLDSGSGSASDTPGGGTSPDAPFATLDFAIGQCSANTGDHIIVLPGHSETFTSAGAVTFDVAGVTVIGIGHGSNRPTFTFDSAATVDWDITAANIVLRNLLFIAHNADINHCLDLSATDLWVDMCEWQDNGTDNFVHYISCHTVANSCDGLKVTRSVAISSDTSNDNFINVPGDIDRLTVQQNYLALGVAASEAIIMAETGIDFTNCLITHNYLWRLNTAGAMAMSSDTTANSGIIAFNVVGHADSASAAPWDVTGTRLFENYALGVDDASGLLLPAVDDDT